MSKNLRKQYKGRVPGGADLVTYWFEKARAQIEKRQATVAGFVATNSIRGGSNRKVLERVLETVPIFEAWSDEPWVNGGGGGAGQPESVSVITNAQSWTGRPVSEIYADLTADSEEEPCADLTTARALAENANTCFMGASKKGSFDITGAQAMQWLALPSNPNGKSNSEVLRPLLNALDIVRRARGMWIIDFGNAMGMNEASLFEAPFEYVVSHVKPERENTNDKTVRENWWRHGRPRIEMRTALNQIKRYIATPAVAKYRLFVWTPAIVLPDQATLAIARDDDTTFGILHSRFHEIWSLKMCTWMGKGNDPRYTPTTCFETFPFPSGLSPNIPAKGYAENTHAQAIVKAAIELNRLRENWLNPVDWVDWVITPAEEKTGFPKRAVAKPGHEADLKKRTLTNLYNARPSWLSNAHLALDKAVAAAYGWSDYTPEMSDEEIQCRLLVLNRQRSTVI